MESVFEKYYKSKNISDDLIKLLSEILEPPYTLGM